MEKEILLECVKDRLEKMGLNYETMEPAVRKNLLKIETEISNRFDELYTAIESINSNRININTISKSGVISNKTVYKYDVLVQYIKSCEDEFNAALPGGKDVEKVLRDKLSDASEVIRKMDLRTVDIELLKVEIDQLKENVNDDAVKIANLTEENMRLSKELQILREKSLEFVEERKGTVVAMPGITLK